MVVLKSAPGSCCEARSMARAGLKGRAAAAAVISTMASASLMHDHATFSIGLIVSQYTHTRWHGATPSCMPHRLDTQALA